MGENGWRSSSPSRRAERGRPALGPVGSLAAELQEAGWSVFWDRRVPPGQTWRQYIGAQLDQSRCVLVLWSRHSISSNWVQEEAEIARQRNLLIPALLEAVTPPFGFQSIQAADLGKWDGTDEPEAFQQLVRAITQILGPSPTEEKRKAQEEEERRGAEEHEESRRAKEGEDERQRAEAQAKKKTELETTA